MQHLRKKRKVFRTSEGSMSPVPERSNAAVGCMNTNQPRSNGYHATFLRYIALAGRLFSVKLSALQKGY